MNGKDAFLKALFEGKLKTILPSEISELFEDEDSQMKPIGKISPELLKEYKLNCKEKELLEEELEVYIRQLHLELKRKVDEAFSVKIDQVNEERASLWRRIEGELGLPDDLKLKINTATGMVSGRFDKPNLTLVTKGKNDNELNH